MVFKLILLVLLISILTICGLQLWYPYGFEGIHWP